MCCCLPNSITAFFRKKFAAPLSQPTPKTLPTNRVYFSKDPNGLTVINNACVGDTVYWFYRPVEKMVNGRRDSAYLTGDFEEIVMRSSDTFQYIEETHYAVGVHNSLKDSDSKTYLASNRFYDDFGGYIDEINLPNNRIDILKNEKVVTPETEREDFQTTRGGTITLTSEHINKIVTASQYNSTYFIDEWGDGSGDEARNSSRGWANYTAILRVKPCRPMGPGSQRGPGGSGGSTSPSASNTCNLRSPNDIQCNTPLRCLEELARRMSSPTSGPSVERITVPTIVHTSGDMYSQGEPFVTRNEIHHRNPTNNYETLLGQYRQLKNEKCFGRSGPPVNLVD